MKILPAEFIREADAFTILKEPISAIDLMERAAMECFRWIDANIPTSRNLKIFCGQGNNGGDGFAIARMLGSQGYEIEVFLTGDPENLSPSCSVNYDRLGDKVCLIPDNESKLPPIEFTDIVVDAIFGSGLTRSVAGIQEAVIRHINASKALVISIDIPSGLFCDSTMLGLKNPAIIRADHTLTFSPPKLALLYPENVDYVGEWHVFEIGLMTSFISDRMVNNFYVAASDCQSLLRRREKFAHKGTFGHAMIICGSRGKMGAAVLAAKGCIRSGPGLVTIHLPGCGEQILQTAVPESMVSLDESEDIFSKVPEIGAYSALAVGPGIGQKEQTCRALKLLIQNSRIPIIFDADAINIIAENKTWLGFIPQGSVFTPHPKEFERLVGKSSDNFERNSLQREFSVRYRATVVLKGAHTAITTPDGKCYFNSTGNPGMATGGSGDVLTGIIAGIMAQGYSGTEAAILAVFLHGLAGDLAFSSKGYEALIASDIIDNLGLAFKSLYGKF